MTLGIADRQGNLLDDVERFCDEKLDERSIYSFLHRERDRLFPDEEFADLFEDTGRQSVPPSVVATVMVLQRLEGLSDREAVERFSFDSRWRYAAGVGGYDVGWLGRASPTPCSSTCASGSVAPSVQTASSRWASRRRERRASSAGVGCSTRRRSMTRWRRWTPSRSSARRSGAC